MYVKSLSVKNLRCFAGAEVGFRSPSRYDELALPNINLLLGNNGAGKTTILRAVALAVLSEILPSSGYVPYNLVRYDMAKPWRRERTASLAQIRASLLLHEEDLGEHSFLRAASVVEVGSFIERIRSGESIEPIQSENGLLREELHDDASPAFLLVGYGATRWVVGTSDFEPIASQSKRRRLRYQRVAGLFEDHIGLTPLSAWHPHLSDERKDEFEELISELLPEGTRFLGAHPDGDYLFEHRGFGVPLGAMSDGYRAYIGWVTDLLFHIATGGRPETRLRDAHGVVMVDEIDLHLHPEWQLEVVPRLAKALPNLQFILTTHSPIVAGTLSPQNIFVVDGESVTQLTEPIHGLNADQVLIGPYFNLETTRAPGVVDELKELSSRAMQGDRQAAVSFLEKLATGSDKIEK